MKTKGRHPDAVKAERDGARAYRGYIIMRNPITADVWIQKDAVKVQSAKSTDEAVRLVDAMLGE